MIMTMNNTSSYLLFSIPAIFLRSCLSEYSCDVVLHKHSRSSNRSTNLSVNESVHSTLEFDIVKPWRQSYVMEHVTLLINIHERSTEPATFYKAYTLRIHVAVSVCSMLHVAKSWNMFNFRQHVSKSFYMSPDTRFCSRIQDTCSKDTRYTPDTCCQQHVSGNMSPVCTGVYWFLQHPQQTVDMFSRTLWTLNLIFNSS